MKLRPVISGIAIVLWMGFCNLRAGVPVVAMAFEVDDVIAEANIFEDWEQQKKPLKKPAQEKGHLIADLVEAIGGAFAELTGANVAPPVLVQPAIDPEPVELQFKAQFVQVQNAELRFVKTICAPTPAEYQTIKLAGDAAVKSAAKECAQVQIQMQQGFRQGQQPQWPDPRKLIVTELAKSVSSTVSADRAKIYQQELNKRAAAQKNAALLNIVAQLDQELVLSAEQRTQLTETLNANWNDAWGKQAEFFVYGGQYLPSLPTERVLPVLNKTQQEIWKQIPKTDYTGAFFGFGMQQMALAEAIDEVPVEENDQKDADAKEAQAKEAQRGNP